MDPKKKPSKKIIDTSVPPEAPVFEFSEVAEPENAQNTLTQEELAQLLQEAVANNKDLQQKNLRLLADIDNLHKQHSISEGASRKSGKKSISSPVVNLITIIKLSFAYVPVDASTEMLQYINTLKTSLAKAVVELEAVGLTLISPEIGAEFDPLTMQALNTSEVHIVKQVVSVGYMLDTQIITPAVILLN